MLSNLKFNVKLLFGLKTTSFLIPSLLNIGLNYLS